MEERELDPVLDLVIDCGRLTIMEDNVGCKYEWLSLTSTMNGWNVRFIRESVHLPNALRFWVEM